MLNNVNKNINCVEALAWCPDEVVAALRVLSQDRQLFISGGTVRDLLLGRKPADLDLTVQRGAVDCCHRLINQLGGGSFVLLGTEEEEAARVVWKGLSIDFSSFRKSAGSIEEELHYRDFTINSLALAISGGGDDSDHGLIDPLGGCRDLGRKTLRSCAGAFADDPLRMLRGVRFCCELGFEFDPGTLDEVISYKKHIRQSAAERISYEMNLIMSTAGAAKSIRQMADTGLLWQIMPELQEGVGVEQPGYHHEDVFNHNLLTLSSIDEVFSAPGSYFAARWPVIEKYLDDGKKRVQLRWAALFHDLGKPATCSSGTIGSGRVTFYNHDRIGRDIFENIAARLRWSRSNMDIVGDMIEMHMHPFHLSNSKRRQGISRKALLKIYKRAGDDLPGLFALAMADSLAGQGELKPANMEDELAQLFDEVYEAVEKHIEPVLKGERLVTGDDLKTQWKLTPGPIFREILDGVELARVEGLVSTRSDAMDWVDKYLQNRQAT